MIWNYDKLCVYNTSKTHAQTHTHRQRSKQTDLSLLSANSPYLHTSLPPLRLHTFIEVQQKAGRQAGRHLGRKGSARLHTETLCRPTCLILPAYPFKIPPINLSMIKYVSQALNAVLCLYIIRCIGERQDVWSCRFKGLLCFCPEQFSSPCWFEFCAPVLSNHIYVLTLTMAVQIWQRNTY